MKKKFSFAIVLFALGIILAAVISIRAVQEAYRSQKINKEVENLQQEAQRIQKENSAIQQRIEYLETSDYIEKVSKDKMNMQKPDENVVIVNQGVAKPQSQTVAEQEVKIKNDPVIPNYKKWWNFFFKY